MTQNTTGRSQAGPPLLAPAIAYGALMIASVATAAGGPRNGTGASEALHYAQTHTGLLHTSGLLAFAAALPLAIWTAVVYRRLRTLGVVAPGAVIGLVGGLLAAASLAVSGLLTWTLGESAPSADPAVAHLLVVLSFVTGAAGFIAPLGLLLAGVTVPSLILRLVPRPLAWAGLVIAAAAVLSTFTLATSALDFTLPIGRFLGLLWILAVSLMLPTSRRDLHRSERVAAPDAAAR